MIGALRAELLKMRKRPSTWVVTGLAIYFVLFTYFIIDFIVYHLALDDAIVLTIPFSVQLDKVLPPQLVENVMSTIAFYVAILAVVFGALTSGSEYGWGTLKTIFTQHSSRADVYVGQTMALAVVVALIVLVVFALATVTTGLMAFNEG